MLNYFQRPKKTDDKAWMPKRQSTDFGAFIAEDGAPGADGATGATGPQGPKGDKGDDGDKLAIVPTSAGPRALFCMEATQAWFYDVLQVPLDDVSSVQVDPVFLETIEVETLCVLSVTTQRPLMIGARIVRLDQVRLVNLRWREPGHPDEPGQEGPPECATVVIGGVRRGRLNKRLPPRTEEQMALNTARWNYLSAHHTTGDTPP